MNRAGILRSLLAAVGILSVGIGWIGIVVPLLPTTPFLLPAAVCVSVHVLRLRTLPGGQGAGRENRRGGPVSAGEQGGGLPMVSRQ